MPKSSNGKRGGRRVRLRPMESADWAGVERTLQKRPAGAALHPQGVASDPVASSLVAATPAQAGRLLEFGRDLDEIEARLATVEHRLAVATREAAGDAGEPALDPDSLHDPDPAG